MCIRDRIQALVNSTNFGYPKRTASGFDLNRLNLLIAVLEKRTKLNLSDKDIYVNVVGGLKLADRAADLSLIHIYMCIRDRALTCSTVSALTVALVPPTMKAGV